MAVIDTLIDSVTGDHCVKDVLVGAFDCMVVSRGAGLSSAFRDPCGPESRCGKGPPRGVTDAGDLIGMSARELAGYARSEKLLEASVGVATVNSLIEPVQSIINEVNAFDVITERGEGKRVVIVGHFPFVKRLTGMADLRVIQEEPWMREEALKEAEKKLPGCEVVAITGSSLINHTFDRLLEISRDAFVIVLGPSTPLSPVLFDLGVDVLCGTVVEDRELALRCIAQGATYREIRGIRRVAMKKNGFVK
jgi:uncharacterized protein (DUF4213/DUF364 family)